MNSLHSEIHCKTSTDMTITIVKAYSLLCRLQRKIVTILSAFQRSRLLLMSYSVLNLNLLSSCWWTGLFFNLDVDVFRLLSQLRHVQQLPAINFVTLRCWYSVATTPRVVYTKWSNIAQLSTRTTRPCADIYRHLILNAAS